MKSTISTALLAVAAWAQTDPANTPPLNLGNDIRFAADERIAEHRWNLTKRFGQAVKYMHNPVLVSDKPWEDSIGFPCVLYDGKTRKYRMWYQAFNAANYFAKRSPAYYVGYAESVDGIHWVKPGFDLIKLGDYGRTNVVMAGRDGKRASGAQVLLNPDQSDPERRFLMVYLDTDGVRLASSPDGLLWRATGPPLLGYHSPFPNHLLWDPGARLWSLYTSPPIHPNGTGPLPEGQRHTERRIAVSVSPDLHDWHTPRTVFYPDEGEEPDYDSGFVFARHQVLFLLYTVMHHETGNSEMDVRLADSPDGIDWHRTAVKPFIPRGSGAMFDRGAVSQSSSPPVEMGDEDWLYYSGSAVTHQEVFRESGIGILRLRKDRFLGLSAGKEPGLLLTREFRWAGDRLVLNCESLASDADAGIQVEIVPSGRGGPGRRLRRPALRWRIATASLPIPWPKRLPGEATGILSRCAGRLCGCASGSERRLCTPCARPPSLNRRPNTCVQWAGMSTG